MSFSFDFVSQQPSQPQPPSITELCESITATHQELIAAFQLMITHLTAFSTTHVESIPNPLDPAHSVMRNPFILTHTEPTPTTMLTAESNAKRRAKINEIFRVDYERDLTTYAEAKTKLLKLIQSLHELYPQQQQQQQQQLPSSNTIPPSPIDLSTVNPHNIHELSRGTILATISEYYEQLQPQTNFATEDEYIQHLLEIKRGLYAHVKRQHEVLETLKTEASALLSTLTLYRQR